MSDREFKCHICDDPTGRDHDDPRTCIKYLRTRLAEAEQKLSDFIHDDEEDRRLKMRLVEVEKRERLAVDYIKKERDDIHTAERLPSCPRGEWGYCEPCKLLLEIEEDQKKGTTTESHVCMYEIKGDDGKCDLCGQTPKD